jgi:hypothetical protein
MGYHETKGNNDRMIMRQSGKFPYAKPTTIGIWRGLLWEYNGISWDLPCGTSTVCELEHHHQNSR